MSNTTLHLWVVAFLMTFWVPIIILVGLAAEGRL